MLTWFCTVNYTDIYRYSFSLRWGGDVIMYIEGGRADSAIVSSHNDHRMAMMTAVMAVTSGGKVTIKGAEAVAKSFPEFYDSLSQLGARTG